MPTYEYVCDKCEHAFDLFQQMSDPVKKKCPKCGAMRLRRLIGTGAGVLFKGSGFYETDYRSDSYKKAADAEKKPDTAEKKSADSATKKSDAAAAPSATGTSSSGKSDGSKPAGRKSGGKGAAPSKSTDN